MIRVGLRLLLLLLFTFPAYAHLGAPATFDLTEEEPGRFRIALTLPITDGRVAKTRPVLPDCIVVEGEPTVREDGLSLTREWMAACPPDALYGTVLGLSGLLGTEQYVELNLRTLDGRQHVAQLRPMTAFFTVPPPPARTGIVGGAVLQGLRDVLRESIWWILALTLALAGVGFSRGIVIALVWGIAQAVGMGVTADPTTAVYANLLRALGGAVACGLAARSILNRPTRPPALSLLAAMAVLLGLAAGRLAAGDATPASLSDTETHLALLSLSAGRLAGGLWVWAVARLLLDLIARLPTAHRRRIQTIGAYVAGSAAAAMGLYYFAGWWLMIFPDLRAALAYLMEFIQARFLAPLTADWTMGYVRIPWLSLLLVLAAVSRLAIRGKTQGRTRWATALAFVMLAVITLPFAAVRVPNPVFSPSPPSSAQARHIMGPLLTRTYRALNQEDEEAAYDGLAETIAGELATTLYLDSRRRLVSEARDAATVTLKNVALLDVGPATPQSGPERAFAYPCRWAVTARVTHWQHSHDRRNLYEGGLTLVVDDGTWKIGGLELRSEERVVVPGSFSSR